MPNNVIASYQVCLRLCQLLKQHKTDYKKSLGKRGKKSDMENAANDFIANFAQGISTVRAGYHDEQDFGTLFDYAEKKYAYAIRNW